MTRRPPSRPEDLVKPGSTAPDFALPDQDGTEVRLSSFRGRPVVLYFYPADFTLGCTIETKHFARRLPDFAQRNAAVLGISTQDSASHKEFQSSCGAEFPLLSDRAREVSSAYGVLTRANVADRVTVVVDEAGKVAGVHRSRIRWWSHVDKALEALDGRPRPPGP